MSSPARKPDAKPQQHDNVKAFDAAVTKSAGIVNYSSPFFIKSHLAAYRGDFEHGDQVKAAHRSNPDRSLRVTVMVDPTVDDFLYHLQRVGRPYGWDKRKKYQTENKEHLKTMIRDNETILYVFQKYTGKNTDSGERSYESIGFCLVAGINEHNKTRIHGQGIKKQDAVDKYKKIKKIPSNAKPIEIYKFGLYDEFTGKGHGHYCLTKVMQELLMKRNYDIVYLDTRDTNHAGVIPFYEGHQFDNFYSEQLSSDLVKESPSFPEPENANERLGEPINGDHPPATTAKEQNLQNDID